MSPDSSIQPPPVVHVTAYPVHEEKSRIVEYAPYPPIIQNNVSVPENKLLVVTSLIHMICAILLVFILLWIAISLHKLTFVIQWGDRPANRCYETGVLRVAASHNACLL